MVIGHPSGNGVQSQLFEAMKHAMYMSSNALLTKARMDDVVHWVVEHDLIRIIEALWKIGGPTIEIFLSQFLVSVVDAEYLDLVQTLLKLGVCPNSTLFGDDGHQQPALRYAILKGNSRLVKLLLDSGVDPNHYLRDYEEVWPLELAFRHLEPRSGCLSEVVKSLVNGGADIFRPRKKEGWDEPLLCRAVKTCTVEVIEYVLGIDEGPALSLREQLNHEKYQRTLALALLAAICSRKIDIVQCLLLHGASVHGSRIENNGDPPVHRWIDCKFRGYLKTPIQVAARYGNTQLVRMLLEKGADVNSYLPLYQIQRLNSFADMGQEQWESFVEHIQTYGPFTALNHSVKNGDLEMMKLLLEEGADPNATDGYTRTSFQMACWRACEKYTNNFEAIHLLLKWGADVNSIVPEFKEGTALNIAASFGNLNLFNFLSRMGAKCTDDPSTLQAAVKGGNLRIVKILSSGQLSVLLSDPKFLGYAIKLRDQSPKMVNYLLRAGCNADALTWCTSKERWMSPLVLATRAENVEVVTILLDWGVNINCRGSGKDMHTPLQEALSWPNHKLVCMLLNQGADPSQMLESIDFAMYLDFQTLGKLIEHGLDVNASFPDSTTLFQAILQQAPGYWYSGRGREEVAIHLLELGADPHQWNGPSFESSLSQVVYLASHHFLRKGRYGEPDHPVFLNLIRELLSRGVNVNTCKVVGDDDGYCIRIETRSSRTDGTEERIYRSFETKGCKFTALQMASVSLNFDFDIINEFLEAGAEINSLAGKDYGLTALQGAILCGRDRLVECLLDRGADVKAPAASHRGWTALQAAALINNDKLVEDLLDRGADVNSPAVKERGATALQYAAMKGNLPMAIKLLDAGANVNAPGAEIKGRTALEGAAEWGRLDMVHLLLNNDGEVETLRERCEGAAKYAERKGHTVIAKILRGWQDR